MLYVILEPVLVLCLSLYIIDLNWISWHLLKYVCKWPINQLLYLSVFVGCACWVENVTILTDFVILDIPEDDSMSIILGRPFLNTAGAVIDWNKSKVTFHINGNEHTVHFPKKQFQVNGINVIEKSPTITIGSFQLPLPTSKKKYEMLIVGDIHIPIEVT